MRVGLISGHGAGDCGACGCGFTEAELTIELVQALEKKFNACGIETIVYPYERNAFKDCNNGELVVDFSDCNYVLELHFNSGRNNEDGDGRMGGSEIYITPRESTCNTENIILSNLEEMGFTNRGVKKENFLVINKVKNLGVSSALVETCFVDDSDDMELYTANKEAVADCIVRGVCIGFSVEYTELKETTCMSREEAENYVATDYVEYLNRLPDAGAENYIEYLVNGGDPEQVDIWIKEGDEYKAPYSNDNYKRQYVIKCYDICLGRFPESEEVIREHMQTARLRDIFYNIYNSEEARNRRG